MPRSSVTWPGYAPWADTVAAFRACAHSAEHGAMLGLASPPPHEASLHAALDDRWPGVHA
jgi:hypothetical protein